jgi:hypothetical protein
MDKRNRSNKKEPDACVRTPRAAGGEPGSHLMSDSQIREQLRSRRPQTDFHQAANVVPIRGV